MERLLPYEHFIKGVEGASASRTRQRTWLFVFAIALQNLPVGLGMASGLVEPLGAVVGAAVLSASASLLPWGLGFAAGAMLFVSSHEIIPESHRKGHEAWARGGLMVGFVVMMLLDRALG